MMNVMTMTNGMPRTAARCAAVAAIAAALAGCSPYVLRGKVIQGAASEVVIVNPDDPRLEQDGVPGANVSLSVDPSRAQRKLLARQSSGETGELEFRIEELGAGMIEYDMGVSARRAGFQRAEGYFKLPTKDKRVLIVLTPGRDVGELDNDLTPEQQVEKYWR